MKPILVLLMPVILCCLIGCKTPAGRLGIHAEVSGLVAQTADGQYALCDLAGVRFGRKPASIELRSYQRIETWQTLKAHIAKYARDVDYAYDVLLGPLPGSTRPAIGALKTSTPSVVIGEGWLLLHGWWPPAKTTTVVAASEGTTAVLQVINDKHERVFFLQGMGVTVKCLADDSISKKLDLVGTFVDISTTGCTISDPLDIAGNDEATKFINEVKAIAAAAGVAWQKSDASR